MVSVTAVKLNDVVRFRLKALGSARKRTVNWMIQEAVSEYVEREEKKENLKKEIFSAWNEYQLTGVHATEEEVGEWLSNLEDGDYKEAPKCHV